MNKEDYMFLQKLNKQTDNKLCDVLNRNGGCNITVCPHCSVDDFMHIEKCELIDEDKEE